MSSKVIKALIAAAAIIGPIATAAASGPSGFFDAEVSARLAGPNCLPLYWDIKRGTEASGVTPLSGPLWFEGNPGLSFASGSSQKDGTFSLTVTTVRGAGPEGMVTGKRNADGSLDVKVESKNACFTGSFHLAPGETSAKL
jgi:hypothetical protein